MVAVWNFGGKLTMYRPDFPSSKLPQPHCGCGPSGSFPPATMRLAMFPFPGARSFDLATDVDLISHSLYDVSQSGWLANPGLGFRGVAACRGDGGWCGLA